MHPLAKRTLRIVAGALFLACGAPGCGDGSKGAAASGGSGGATKVAGTRANSCTGMSGTECQHGDCCARLPVPGGTFQQGAPTGFSSTVSSYTLDEFEVTVARFRNFAAAYEAWRAAGNPAPNSGANASIPGSGWDPSWNDSLPADADALTNGASIACSDPTFPTWSASGNDTLPLNCVDWFTSFAFCIWDGGRLPTESEWEYATARGTDDTLYAWGNVPVPDNMLDTGNLAVYECLGDGDADHCSFADILAVGSRPDGNGRFGQSDLAGSMWEWTLDWVALAGYPAAPQTNYANLAAGDNRVIRGGDWSSPASTLLAAARYSYGEPHAHFTNVGFRCAGNP